jgi:hypothetical protein
VPSISQRPVPLQLKKRIPWGKEWTEICSTKNWNPMPTFNTNLIWCTQIKKHQFIYLWCDRISIWKRQENNALCQAPVGKVFQCDGAPPHFSKQAHAFLEREFPDHWIWRRGHIPWPPCSTDLTLLDSFLEICKIRYCEKVRNVNELCDNHQSCRVHYQWNACQHLARTWISWCVLSLMVPIWISTNKIRHFVRSSL